MDWNPQNEDPHFERRLLMAFALAVLLFVTVLPYLSKKTGLPPAPVTTPAATTSPAPQAPTPAAAPPKIAPAPAAAAVPRHSAAATGAATVSAAQEQLVTINTPVFHVVLSNHGASARTWVLTQYKDDAGKPLDFVDPGFAAKAGFPLDFWVSDTSLREQLDRALYTVKTTTAADGTQTVDFQWSDGTLVAHKTLRFDQSYVARVKSSVTRNGQPVPVALAWQGAFGDRAVPGDFNTEQLLQSTPTSVDLFSVKKVQNGAVHQGQFHFVGLEDQFFTAVFLPADDPTLAVTTLKTTYRPKLVDASGNSTSDKDVDTIGLAVSDGATNDTALFVGPKKIDLLKSVDPALRGLVDFGWFSFVADPLFLWMNWTYTHWIHNYGWVIIFITFVITMATFPLKMKAQKSQAIMLALQPKVNALNAKAKKYGMRDPRRQEAQSEVMKLYSEHGANPLGGCLPMLIQLPLIYAFWRVLEYAIELRHAPWIGYIHDLSAKDPLYILPVGLVIVQFFSMQFMPTSPGTDPRQMKMMKWLMPVFMGYIFFYLPSGVNLYYLFSMAIGIGQQVVANRTYNDAAVAKVAAIEAGKKKKAISSKS